MSRARTITITLGSLAAGALLATGVSGLALADDRPGPQSPSAGAQGRAPHDEGGRHGHGPGGRHGGPLGQPLHGELVVKADDGTISTVRTIHGTVTSVSASSITVRAEDGYSATFAVTSDTEVRVGPPERGPGHSDGREEGADSSDTIADVSVGDTVHVDGKVTGATATAAHVVVHEDRPTQGS